jgi:hypothetical protein
VQFSQNSIRIKSLNQKRWREELLGLIHIPIKVLDTFAENVDGTKDTQEQSEVEVHSLRHRATKEFGGVDECLQALLTSALDVVSGSLLPSFGRNNPISICEPHSRSRRILHEEALNISEQWAMEIFIIKVCLRRFVG